MQVAACKMTYWTFSNVNFASQKVEMPAIPVFIGTAGTS
jgi:hypothetical protein